MTDNSDKNIIVHSPRALFYFMVGGKRRPIFPLRALLYLPAGLTALLAVLLLTNYMLGGELVWTKEWKKQNDLIAVENNKRILNTFDEPFWNTAGMPFTIEKKTSKKRILVVGDSYIFGDGHINLNDLWWRELQRKLEEEAFHNIEVIAIGVNGASTQDQWHWLFELNLLKAIDPDLVIFGYVGNDPIMKDTDGKNLVKQLPYSLKVTESTLFEKLFSYAFNMARRLIQQKADDINVTYNDATGYPYAQWLKKIVEGENFERYKQLLKRLGQEMNETAVPYFVVTTLSIPTKNAFIVDQSKVWQAFADAKITLYDLLPEYIRQFGHIKNYSYLWVNPSNAHPGPLVTRFYADQVYDILIDHYQPLMGRRDPNQKAPLPSINNWFPGAIQPQNTSTNQWRFNYPLSEQELLWLPVKKGHIALNFERPVSIQSIKLTLSVAADIQLWVTTIDQKNGYDSLDYTLAGDGHGKSVTIDFDKKLQQQRITSLRIAIDDIPDQQRKPREVVTIDPRQIKHKDGNSYEISLPQLAQIANNNDFPLRSPLLLKEDSTILEKKYDIHSEIAEKGEGGYSHWGNMLIFSSSDNSDPRTNQKVYQLIEPAKPMDVKLDIDFVESSSQP